VSSHLCDRIKRKTSKGIKGYPGLPGLYTFVVYTTGKGGRKGLNRYNRVWAGLTSLVFCAIRKCLKRNIPHCVTPFRGAPSLLVFHHVIYSTKQPPAVAKISET